MIHMSADTAGVIKDRFWLESRGVVDIKGKGPMETFLLSAQCNLVAISCLRAFLVTFWHFARVWCLCRIVLVSSRRYPLCVGP